MLSALTDPTKTMAVSFKITQSVTKTQPSTKLGDGMNIGLGIIETAMGLLKIFETGVGLTEEGLGLSLEGMSTTMGVGTIPFGVGTSTSGLGYSINGLSVITFEVGLSVIMIGVGLETIKSIGVDARTE